MYQLIHVRLPHKGVIPSFQWIQSINWNEETANK